MQRFAFALLGLSLWLTGCCGPCRHADWCHAANCCSLCDHSENCYCLTDGSESPRYRPPGPWWTRPDGDCPDKCCRYQEWKDGVKDEVRESVNWRY
jgi:hypothetical protein